MDHFAWEHKRAVVFVTGMSGTGKSTALAELGKRGHRTVDTDLGGYSEKTDHDGMLWVEDRITALLDGHKEGALFVAGTVSNQGAYYPRFDAVVLLSAPLPVMLDRIAARTTNHYGKRPEERDEIIHYFHTVEPLLRQGASHEIDTNRPLHEVVTQLERIAVFAAK